MQVGEGMVKGFISLKSLSPDYEAQSSYTLTLTATDKGGLISTADVEITIVDTQDEPPKFLNSPYSITVDENTPPSTQLLTINVQDGDATNKRRIHLDVIKDPQAHFSVHEDHDNNWILQTSNVIIDRENPEILLNGDIYQITLRAREIVSKDTFGDISYENVSIVIHDVNDQVRNLLRVVIAK